MLSGFRAPGRRACAAGRRKPSGRRLILHPNQSGHAGTRWVTERITARVGGTHPNQKVETTGRNRALNAACETGKRQRQLLRKRLSDRIAFSRLTAHANGRPLSESKEHQMGHKTLASPVSRYYPQPN